MLKIGDFARLARVPVKTLRYYDEIGLLHPAGIDHYTRYRYYTSEQLPTLNCIRRLRDLGFSLEDVSLLIQSGLAREPLVRSLRKRRSEIETQIRDLQRQLSRVETQLTLVSEDNLPAGYTAVLSELQHLSNIKKGKEEMEPKFVKRDKFFVVGLPYLGRNQNNEIPQLWDQFMPRMGEIKHLWGAEEAAYGLCSENNKGLIDYMACLQVSELKDIPEGMVGKEIPAQTYVVFESDGVKDIHATYDRILKQWLPSSGYDPGDGPDFEYYPPDFRGSDSRLYIYFPIKEK
jgi:predicted transcriptional regulator YdeE